MNPIPQPSARWVWRFFSLGLRVYVLSLFLAAVVSLLWLLGGAEALEPDAVGVIWIAVAAMGLTFLVIVVPMFYSARLRRR